MGKLALYGGTPVIRQDELPEDLFHWPIVNDAMRAAQAEVLKAVDQYGADGYKGGVALSVRKL